MKILLSQEHLVSLNMDPFPGNLNTCFLFFNKSFLDLKAMLTKFGNAFAMLKQIQELKPQTRSIQSSVAEQTSSFLPLS